MTNPAIIFDLDGTLWDSTYRIRDIWNAVIEKETGAPSHLTREDICGIMGKTMEEIAAAIFPDRSKPEQAALMDLCGKAENAELCKTGAILYEGLEETLRTLSADHTLFIVSNCQDGYIQAFLESHKLGKYFSDIEMYGRTGSPKGDNIRLIMERNGITDAVYVGDTAGDQKAAKLAGIPFIHAAYGFGAAAAPAGVIGHFTELPALLQKLTKNEGESLYETAKNR